MKSWISEYNLTETLLFLSAFFLELATAFWAVGILILADTFTGLWAAFVKKEKRDSERYGKILAKIILYPLAIIVAKVSQEYLSPEIPWVSVSTGIIATVEVRSVYDNISKVFGYDLWVRVKEAIWPIKNKKDEK